MTQRPASHQYALDKEQGLARQLNERQLSMIAIGGAIGTGLFLGSALAGSAPRGRVSF